MREDDLCDGHEHQARGCPRVSKLKCTECGTLYDPRLGDVSLAAPPCPACGMTAAVVERCDTCPVLEVGRVRAQTAAGRLLERVLELDFETRRFKIDWSEVTAEEAVGLKVLEQEREKWRDEQMRDRQEKWEEEMRRRQVEERRKARGF